MREARFIVFEGLDGAGTTTQAARLAERLRHEDVQVHETKEPSTGPLGRLLRDALEHRAELDPVALALTFAADRADHLQRVVAHLQAGTWVVSDRYVLSSLAYQPSAEVPLEWVEQINRFAMAPDVTVFVDTDVETCLRRIAQRGGDAELFDTCEELERIDSNYRALLERGTKLGHLVTVDGTAAPDAVADAVWARLGLSAPR